jgi:hypothetical protein
MRVRWTVPLFSLVLLPLCAIQAQQSTQLTGCVSQDASGTLHLEAQPSRQIYRLEAPDVENLQRHLNQQLTIRGHSAGDIQTTAFTVESFDVLSDNCTSPLQSQDTSQIAGKVGPVEVATPVTSVGSAGETTAGFQTEAGLEQASGVKAGTPTPRLTRAPFRPMYAEHAGESSMAAEVDAQAASRAEPYPGTTLGVDIKTAPPSSVQASQHQTNPETSTPE